MSVCHLGGGEAQYTSGWHRGQYCILDARITEYSVWLYHKSWRFWDIHMLYTGVFETYYFGCIICHDHSAINMLWLSALYSGISQSSPKIYFSGVLFRHYRLLLFFVRLQWRCMCGLTPDLGCVRL